jgi:hypothetical protein
MIDNDLNIKMALDNGELLVNILILPKILNKSNMVDIKNDVNDGLTSRNEPFVEITGEQIETVKEIWESTLQSC